VKKAFTLIELLIVIIVIGILAGLGLPQYLKTKERALDDEATVNLKIIQAAEKIYHMETGVYQACANNACLNNNLKLSLPQGSARNWRYYTDAAGTAAAERLSGTPRTWFLEINGNTPYLGDQPF
jgi:prepilin-type N-terminal cleavage/methylation domain-containing protein